jgi:pimeloyl-ACP methyl ester carboxylesterase
MIAQEFYRHHPDRVAALVLCDTAAKIGTDEVWD